MRAPFYLRLPLTGLALALAAAMPSALPAGVPHVRAPSILAAATPAARPAAGSQAAGSQRAQSPETQRTAAAILALLNRQAADWNRGDLDAFATGYKNSPDILFISQRIEHGYSGMLAGYKAHYPTREAMGTLSFTQLAVQPLDLHFATTTGHYHLQRSTAGGGDAEGYFLLVLEQIPGGWKIVRDDTTTTSPMAAPTPAGAVAPR